MVGCCDAAWSLHWAPVDALGDVQVALWMADVVRSLFLSLLRYGCISDAEVSNFVEPKNFVLSVWRRDVHVAPHPPSQPEFVSMA